MVNCYDDDPKDFRWGSVKLFMRVQLCLKEERRVGT
jgi:hypothetical protein